PCSQSTILLGRHPGDKQAHHSVLERQADSAGLFRDRKRSQGRRFWGSRGAYPSSATLFAPLKKYVACEKLPPLTISSTSSTSPSSPDSPEMMQLR
ncbi:hypothetical protein KUCAC02_016459, partial [Chaenocephalus aceratus]